MSKPFVFEKPLGMRDTLPGLYETTRQLKTQLEDDINNWGYQLIQTPSLEYYETVGAASAIRDQQLFKLLDRQGKTLVLRPDMTAPIARVAASTLRQVAYPMRLAYNTTVFRAQRLEGGRPAEFEQIGVELIGDGTPNADGEVIALLVQLLKQAGLSQFKVAVGHVGYVNALLHSAVTNQADINRLRDFLYKKNVVGYRQAVKQLDVTETHKQRLLELPKLRGGRDQIKHALELLPKDSAQGIADQLTRLWHVLEAYHVTDNVMLDLTLVEHMDYYTGIVFETYDENLGSALASGGRYDELLEKFERPAQATGFAIRVDQLVEAVGNQASEPDVIGILFSSERINEAIISAQNLRKSGHRVVMQDIAAVTNIDEFTNRFTDVRKIMDDAGRLGDA